MTRYLAGRALQSVVVVLGAMLTVFVAMNLVSDPAAALLPVGTPDDVVERFRESHGLSEPVIQRLFTFIGDAARGDFGQSIWLGRDALDAALERLPATLLLTVPPVIIGALLGVTLGAVSARRPDSKLSQLLDVVSYALISIAEFWIAIMLILLFAVHLQLLPTGGATPKPQVLVLPMIVLGMRPFAQTYQLGKATMTAEYGKQYVLAARARGVTERAIAAQHVLKNVAVPIVTFVCYDLGRIFVGVSIVVEVIFAWPGVGSLAVAALERGDLYLVQAIVLIVAAVSAGMNFLADALYLMLDPRTRHLIGRSAR